MPTSIIARKSDNNCPSDAKERGSGQFDRMFKEPRNKRKESLRRITRNARIYLAVFYQHDQLRAKEIIELEPDVVRSEAERQLDRSSNAISHVGLTIRWAKANGIVVYADNDHDKQV